MEGGTAGCRADFDSLLARDYEDARYFAVHRLFVDAYCLQHPDDFCRSAKSLAAHLVGLQAVVEGGGDTARGPDALRRWLDGPGSLPKPQVPDARGGLTLSDLPRGDDPGAWAIAVRRWADDVWAAYADLHPTARAWAGAAQNQ